MAALQGLWAAKPSTTTEHGRLNRTVAGRGCCESFTYTACYCEENVHRLVPTLVERGFTGTLQQLYAVFISNASKQMPLWQQRAGLTHGHRRRGGQGLHGGEGPSGTDSGSSSSESNDGSSSSGAGRGTADEHGSNYDSDSMSSDSGDDEGFVVWDYHVILLQAPASSGPLSQPNPAPARLEDTATASRGQRMDTRVPSAAPPPGPPSEEASASRAAAAVPANIGAAAGAAAKARARVKTLVWDLDTLLPMPCSLKTYARRALKVHYQLPERNRRLYRVVPAATYLRNFASDRSHMRTPGGGWNAPPPPYPPLVAADGTTHNIHMFWDMTAAEQLPAVEASATATARAVACGGGGGGSGAVGIAGSGCCGTSGTAATGASAAAKPRHAPAPVTHTDAESCGPSAAPDGSEMGDGGGGVSGRADPEPEEHGGGTEEAVGGDRAGAGGGCGSLPGALKPLMAPLEGPYGVVLDEISFLEAFGVDVDALIAARRAALKRRHD